MVNQTNLCKFKIPIESDSGIRMTYGIKHKQIKSVFSIDGDCWITCLTKQDYAEALDWIESQMRKRLVQFLKDNEWLEYKFIFDFGLAPNNMKIGKSKFLNFSIFFKLKEERKMNSIKSKVEFEIVPLIDEMKKDFETCGFQVGK